MKYLSIIVPMYNVEKYIGRCLDSIIGQGLPEDEYEIILIDDGSRDNTLQIAKDYAAKYPFIRVLEQTNGGASKARNNGLDHAQGKYIYFVDGDDALIPNSLIHAYKYISPEWINDNHDNGIPQIVTFQHVVGKGDTMRDIVQNSDEFSAVSYQTGCAFLEHNEYHNSVWWYFVDRSLIQSLGLRFELGKIAQDAPFTAALMISAKRVIATNIKCYFYSYNDQSATKSSNIQKILKVLDGEIYASTALHNMIASTNEITDKCKERIESHRDLMIFNALLMSMKYLSLSDAHKVLVDLRSKGMYPFNGKSLCNTALDRILLMAVSYPVFFYSSNILKKLVGVFKN